MSTGWRGVDNVGYWFGKSSSGSWVVANCNDFDNAGCVVYTVGTGSCVTGNYGEVKIAVNTQGATYGCEGTTLGTI